MLSSVINYVIFIIFFCISLELTNEFGALIEKCWRISVHLLESLLRRHTSQCSNNHRLCVCVCILLANSMCFELVQNWGYTNVRACTTPLGCIAQCASALAFTEPTFKCGTRNFPIPLKYSVDLVYSSYSGVSYHIFEGPRALALQFSKC